MRVDEMDESPKYAQSRGFAQLQLRFAGEIFWENQPAKALQLPHYFCLDTTLGIIKFVSPLVNLLGIRLFLNLPVKLFNSHRSYLVIDHIQKPEYHLWGSGIEIHI